MTISGALALLTNLVLAWTTHQIQEVVDQWASDAQCRLFPHVLPYITPTHFRQINFRGQFRFPVDKARARLIPSAVA